MIDIYQEKSYSVAPNAVVPITCLLLEYNGYLGMEQINLRPESPRPYIYLSQAEKLHLGCSFC